MSRGATADHESASPRPASRATQPWHQIAVEAVLDELNSSPHGLGAEEARRRLLLDGPNELREGKR
jgi:Cation transporter/ATPase, N-terminus